MDIHNNDVISKHYFTENICYRLEVKTSIENQGKLTDEIVESLEKARTLAEVEDIYRQ